jgi:hypothetical protein
MTQQTPVSIEGLDACLPMFGLPPDGAVSADGRRIDVDG